jgi:hypothetical protein
MSYLTYLAIQQRKYAQLRYHDISFAADGHDNKNHADFNYISHTECTWFYLAVPFWFVNKIIGVEKLDLPTFRFRVTQDM